MYKKRWEKDLALTLAGVLAAGMIHIAAPVQAADTGSPNDQYMEEMQVQDVSANVSSSANASPSPSANASPSPLASPSPSPSANASPSPSASVSPSPSANVSPSPSANVSPSPSANVSPSPSANASPSPSANVSPSPSANASPSPSANVSPSPSASPSPTVSSSPHPTASPKPSQTVPAVKKKVTQNLKARYTSKKMLRKTVGDRVKQKITGAKTKVVYTSSDKKVAKITKVNCERGNWCEITCVGAGKAVITARAKANSKYKAASKSFTLYVSPQKAKVVSLRSDRSGQVTIKSSDAAKGCDGYQIYYKHDGKLVKRQVKGRKPLNYTIKNLKSGKNIRVRIRTYRVRKGTTYYGKYSAWKTLDRVR